MQILFTEQLFLIRSFFSFCQKVSPYIFQNNRYHTTVAGFATYIITLRNATGDDCNNYVLHYNRIAYQKYFFWHTTIY